MCFSSWYNIILKIVHSNLCYTPSAFLSINCFIACWCCLRTQLTSHYINAHISIIFSLFSLLLEREGRNGSVFFASLWSWTLVSWFILVMMDIMRTSYFWFHLIVIDTSNIPLFMNLWLSFIYMCSWTSQHFIFTLVFKVSISQSIVSPPFIITSW